MKRLLLVPLVVAAALVLYAVPAVAAGVSPGTYTPSGFGAGPSGAHLQSGSPSCTVFNNLSVSCIGYQLAGVGNTNADVVLTANYSAIIDCTNHGGQLVEAQTKNFAATSEAKVTSAKNGRMTVPTRSVNPAQVGQVCPNPNWTPSIRPGTLVLNSFSYTLTFAGFGSPFITIAQP